MSSIHGLSHKALKYFRKKPATLAVYWIYVSRTNHEGVAWPTIRGLKRDTGWSADSCAEARTWLVNHQALEKVEKYVQPNWRNLEAKIKAQRVNLDQSEYYRPTGYLVVDDVKYSMLYFGAMEVSDIETEEQDSSHVRPRRTTKLSNNEAIEQRPGSTELGISISEPATSNTKPDSIKDSAPIGTPPVQVPVVATIEEKIDVVGLAEEYVAKIAPPKPKNPRQEAACIAWGIEPGWLAETLAKQTMGGENKGKRKEYAIDPPMPPVEVVAAFDWYKTEPRYKDQKALPQSAETLFERMMEFRAQPDHDKYVARATRVFEARLNPTPIEPPKELPPPNADYAAKAEEIIQRLARGESIHELISA